MFCAITLFAFFSGIYAYPDLSYGLFLSFVLIFLLFFGFFGSFGFFGLCRLSFSEKSVKAIAEELGFDSVNTMLRMFRNRLGQYPMEVRSEVRKRRESE